MTKEDFIKCIDEPVSIRQDSLTALGELSKKYPWSQSIHILYTKGLHNIKSVDYLDHLKYTAALSADRKVLYHFVMQAGLLEKIERLSPDKEEVEEPVLKIETKEQEESVTKQPVLTPEISAEKDLIITSKEELGELISQKIAESFKENVALKFNLEHEQKIEEEPLPLENAVVEEKEDTEKQDVLTTSEEKEKIATQSSHSQNYSELEKQILWEAVNSSIQVDVTSQLEDLPELEAARESTVLDEVLKKFNKDAEPIDFESKKTFFTWLTPNSNKIDEKKNTETAATEDLIDKFLKNDPKITPQKTEFYTPGNVAKLSIVDSEDFVSETLAVIYIKQGYYPKAIRVFEKLSLKFPEKSTYFAARIKELESLQKSNKK